MEIHDAFAMDAALDAFIADLRADVEARVMIEIGVVAAPFADANANASDPDAALKHKLRNLLADFFYSHAEATHRNFLPRF